MKSLPLVKRQILILLVFSVLTAILSIIHGIFFDLNFSEISRLTFEGIVITFIVIFPAVLFLEWVFDMNNKDKISKLEKRLSKVERKK